MKPRLSTNTHLLVKVNERVVGQLEGLDGQQDTVPVATFDVGDEAVDAFHRVERDGGFLLQGAQRSVEVVLLEILHNQADHAAETTGENVLQPRVDFHKSSQRLCIVSRG